VVYRSILLYGRWNFFNGRKQFVLTAVSSTTTVGAGTPQGTVPGPSDFKLIIIDLKFTKHVKYVDDTTVLQKC